MKRGSERVTLKVKAFSSCVDSNLYPERAYASISERVDVFHIISGVVELLNPFNKLLSKMEVCSEIAKNS